MKTDNLKVTAQRDLFQPDVDMSQFVGELMHSPYQSIFTEEHDVELLGAPAWNEKINGWVALANVRGMLCAVEVSIST